MRSNESRSRRSFIQAMIAAPLLHGQAAVAPPILHGHGKIAPPVPVPDVPVARQDGISTTLLPIVKGHVTAVQLMFTSCTTTCPIGGAILS